MNSEQEIKQMENDLRDAFAMSVLPSLTQYWAGKNYNVNEFLIASSAYKIADDLMRERAKRIK